MLIRGCHFSACDQFGRRRRRRRRQFIINSHPESLRGLWGPPGACYCYHHNCHCRGRRMQPPRATRRPRQAAPATPPGARSQPWRARDDGQLGLEEPREPRGQQIHGRRGRHCSRLAAFRWSLESSGRADNHVRRPNYAFAVRQSDWPRPPTRQTRPTLVIVVLVVDGAASIFIISPN